MGKYDFSYAPDRSGSGSIKWDAMRRESQQLPDGIVPLSVAEMEFPVAPEIRDAMVKAVQLETPGYSCAYEEYYEAVINWMGKRHGWKIEKEWICPTNGVIPAIDAVIDTIGHEGCGVIIMPPVYPPFYGCSSRNGCHTVKCPLIYNNGNYAIDFELLKEQAVQKENRILLLCNPHNPVGRVWTKDELQTIGDICYDNGIYVISDEIHFDLIMPGYQHTMFSVAVPKMAQQSFICTAPSKTFNIAGLETSNLIVPNEKLREAIPGKSHGSPSFLGYRACIGAYNHADAWLDECLSVINGNAKKVQVFLKEKLPWVVASPMEGTYLMWLDFNQSGLQKEQLEKIMKEHHLFLCEGSMFGEEGNGFERVAIAVPPHVLDSALDRLYQALKDIKL